MAKIARFTGNLKAFASSATGVFRTVFGGVAQSDILDDNINTELLEGWESGTDINGFPPIQYFNAATFTSMQLSAYLHQVGIAEWDSLQEYHIPGLTMDSNGVIYRSKVNNNIGNIPSASPAEWLDLSTVAALSDHNKTVHDALNIDAETLDGINSTDFLLVANEKVKAWVNFSGSGVVAIRQAHNVGSITDNGVGDYTVNYTSALTDGNGAINVDAGDQDTVTVGNGSGYWGASGTTSVNIQTYNVVGAAVQDFTAVGVTVCR